METQQTKNNRFEGVIQNILGEVLWHTLILDPSIPEISDQHFSELKRVLDNYLANRTSSRKTRILEVAAYAHTTGYKLAQAYDAEVVLSDISIDSLGLGKQIAQEMQIDGAMVTRVAADFHDLPFESGSFDLVFIASAIHHTWDWERVLEELIRVTAGSGLLVIANEPCARELCFYKFRTNRKDQYRALEKVLEQEGVLRTVSEPYLGSRQEELFGMVENQSIPIDKVLQIIRENGEIIELGLSPEICIEEFEKTLLASRDMGVDAIAGLARYKLLQAVEKARKVLGDHETKMGYSLPTTEEIAQMSNKVAALIDQLDSDTRTEKYRTGLSRLFGASIRIIMKKNPAAQASEDRTKLRYNWGTRNNVIIGYPEEVQDILCGSVDCLPDVQKSDREELVKSFPGTDWDIDVSGSGIRTLTPSGRSSRIICSAGKGAESVLVLFRVYAVYDSRPYRITLAADAGSTVVASLDIYQTDSYLMKADMAGIESIDDLQLVLFAQYLEEDDGLEKPVFNISAARILGVNQVAG